MSNLLWLAFGKNKTGWIDYNGRLISADKLADKTNCLNASDIMRLAKANKYNLRLVSSDEAKNRLGSNK